MCCYTCIEFDGSQHFESKKFFGGDKIFEVQKIKDNIKTTFCLDNNIKLIRFNYLQNEKDIRLYLDNTFD